MPASPQRLVRAKAAATYLGKTGEIAAREVRMITARRKAAYNCLSPPVRISKMAFGFQLLLGF
jgi:hypothetical protein